MSPTSNIERRLTLGGTCVTFFYTNKTDNIKKGITRMILYNKRNTSYFRNHIVIAHKSTFHTFFLTWMGDQRLWLVMMTPPLGEVWRPLYNIRKLQMMSPLALVQYQIIL